MTVDLGELADAVADVVRIQPELFQAQSQEPDVVEPAVIAAARSFAAAPRHTGRTATRDEARCVAAFAMLTAGVSRREIARRLGMGRHTLAAIESEFEQGGKLAPLKQRVERQLALLVAEVTEEVRDTLESGRRDADAAQWLKAAGTVLGISFDKHALATGGPTEIVQHKGPPAWQAVDEWYRRMAQIGQAPDSESGGDSLQRKALCDAAPPMVTVEIVEDAAPAGHHQVSSATAAAQVEASAGGGGGAPASGGGGNGDGSTGFPNSTQGAT